MKQRNRFKALPLCFPFTLDKLFWEDSVMETDRIFPFFHRNGLYFDRYERAAWIEIDGEAWLFSSRTFLYRLKLLSHHPLSDKERLAIKTLINLNRCPNDLRQLLYFETEWQMIRDVRLGHPYPR